jgi:uncharacterized protein (DUF362 family)
VAVVDLPEARYPDGAPFHPSEAYPEYPFPGEISTEENLVYEGVRRLFRALGLDGGRFGTAEWNPLGGLITPGMHVVLKPNFVRSRHRDGKDLFSIVTHGSVIRAVADYAWIALRGEGRITIADAPQYDCDFEELTDALGLDRLVGFYAGARGPKPHVTLRDLRAYWSRGRHFPSMSIPLPGDPEGTVTVDLGRRSALHGRPGADRLYGAVYHRKETSAHHSGERQEYALSRTVMGADVVISIPKMKVHKKVGVTLNAKGLVGIATNKNFLVHYTLRPPSGGGDQYPDGHFGPLEERLIRIERWMYDRFLAPRRRPLEYLHRSIYALHGALLKPLGIRVRPEKRLLDAGNWHGNDSAWRMTADLLHAFTFADADGMLHERPQRRVFSVVDGVVGGEGPGPLTPDPKPAGVLLAGENLLAVDLVATRLMGFDPMRLALYRHALNGGPDYGVKSPADEIEVVCPTDRAKEACLEVDGDPFLGFRPHPGWVGHVEAAAR